MNYEIIKKPKIPIKTLGQNFSMWKVADHPQIPTILLIVSLIVSRYNIIHGNSLPPQITKMTKMTKMTKTPIKNRKRSRF